MDLEIINIGDELLIGQVLNTNAAFVAKRLNKQGIRVVKVTTIGDEPKDITAALDSALANADCVLMTGGLGPTKDDMTKNILAEYFHQSLVEHSGMLKKIEHYFALRQQNLTPTNRKQALLPQNAIIIENNVGTAAGMCFKKGTKLVFSLPGVPFEMAEMMPEVERIIKENYQTGFIVHRTLLLSGIGESYLSDMIQEWEDALPCGVKVAYLPNAGLIRLRLSAYGGDESVLQEIERQIERLLPLIKDYFIGFEKDNISQTLAEKLISLSANLAVAESCSGGNLAHQITLNQGASSYFKGSVTAYSNEVKEQVLQVKKDVLLTFGAVSEQTAVAMAEGVMRLFDSDFAISTTGIAGPTGGTAEKPIGTVWICVCDNKGNKLTKKCFFPTTRSNFIERTTNEAFFLLLKLMTR
ncbi:MAG: competence/damage-inducible protein A [Bacteroidales bacterium]|nr:competence/damage-inducible protein A [Bacteroidales bacterium]